MTNQQAFKRGSEDGLIIVPCQLDNDPLGLAIDTGASHTTIDMTNMIMAGYEIQQALSVEKIETASGIIDAYVFEVTSFSSLGLTKTNFKVCAYDFFAYHYLTDFDGVLGLDFFKGIKLCIDMEQNEISISSNL